MFQNLLGCFDMCLDGRAIVIGPYAANPLIPYYRRFPVGKDFVKKCPQLLLGCKPWWLLRGAVYDRYSEDPEFAPNFPQVAGAEPGLVAGSMLKIELLWTEIPKSVRRVVFDAGTGFDIPFGPTFDAEAHLLVPHPSAYTGPLPEEFPESTGFSQVALSALVMADAELRQGVARYTQSIFLEPETQGSFTLQVPALARSLQVYGENGTEPVIEFLFDASGLIVLGQALVGDTENTHQIPQTARFIRLSLPGMDPSAEIFTIVFKLEI